MNSDKLTSKLISSLISSLSYYIRRTMTHRQIAMKRDEYLEGRDSGGDERLDGRDLTGTACNSSRRTYNLSCQRRYQQKDAGCDDEIPTKLAFLTLPDKFANTTGKSGRSSSKQSPPRNNSSSDHSRRSSGTEKSYGSNSSSSIIDSRHTEFKRTEKSQSRSTTSASARQREKRSLLKAKPRLHSSISELKEADQPIFEEAEEQSTTNTSPRLLFKLSEALKAFEGPEKITSRYLVELSEKLGMPVAYSCGQGLELVTKDGKIPAADLLLILKGKTEK